MSDIFVDICYLRSRGSARKGRVLSLASQRWADLPPMAGEFPSASARASALSLRTLTPHHVSARQRSGVQSALITWRPYPPASVWLLPPDHPTWCPAAERNSAALARGSEGDLLVFGGRTERALATVERLSPGATEWIRVSGLGGVDEGEWIRGSGSGGVDQGACR